MAKIAIPEGIAPKVELSLRQSSEMHSHAWPRLVLSIRMGILAGKLLEIPVPQTDKRLLTIMETDGCAADGVSVATNCWVGRRPLRIEDYGKIHDLRRHPRLPFGPHRAPCREPVRRPDHGQRRRPLGSTATLPATWSCPRNRSSSPSPSSSKRQWTRSSAR